MRSFVSNDCFIISPIGDETEVGKVLHDHVERVRINIIDAALNIVNEKRGLSLLASRSDMRLDHGGIREHFLKAIISDQLLFVVLTYAVKPNVYYELGIAHSAARPIIVLSDKRLKKREFDIYDIKVIYYSFDETDSEGKSFGTIIPIQEVVSHIEHILDHEEDEFAFVAHNPLGKHTRSLRPYDEFQNISYSYWGEILNRANKRIDFYGTTLDELTKRHGNFQFEDGTTAKKFGLRDFLALKVLLSGINVTIAMLHPDNPALEALLKPDDTGVDPMFLDAVKEEIETSVSKWQSVADYLEKLQTDDLARRALTKDLRTVPTPSPRRGSFKVVQIRHGLSKFRVTLTENEAIVTPFFYEPAQNSKHPAFEARKQTALYKSVLREHDHLLAINENYTVASIRMGESRAV